jgi:hypothetical protein
MLVLYPLISLTFWVNQPVFRYLEGNNMLKWEYRVVEMRWTEIKQLDPEGKERDVHVWITEFSNGNVEGIENILNAYGDGGWELVGIVPINWGASFGVDRLYAHFKRPITGPL